jgi:hypothetical protein
VTVMLYGVISILAICAVAYVIGVCVVAFMAWCVCYQ